ncbi:MAG: GntR family transcriptional regulator [Verrucomicrobiales bacterium]|nr:GntR family transcriptional regulator [Verrucomicrobiales bacterium]
MAATEEVEEPRYRRLASDLEKSIEDGVFRPGEKIPSVRATSRSHRVSVSTVLAAYALLEDKGCIEGKRRSGYFVKVPKERGPAPTITRHRAKPVEVNTSSIHDAVMRAVSDPDVVPFGAAIPGPEMLPFRKLTTYLNSRAREMGGAAFTYSTAPGALELRVQIAKRCQVEGTSLSPEDIVCTLGASEALVLALNSVADAGDLIAVESPTYFGVLNLIRRMGYRAIEVSTHPQTGLDLNSLQEVLDQHEVAAVFVQPNFQNPMGGLMPVERKEAMVKLCTERGVPIIEDEIFGDLNHDGTRPPSLKAFDREGMVIQCGGYSKTLSPGMRVGWMAPGRYLGQVMSLKNSLSPSNETLSELAIADFLRSGGVDRHLRSVRSTYFKQMHLMRNVIFDCFPEGTTVTEPKGGFLLWIELPEGADTEKLAVAAFREKISIVPGSIFSASCRFQNCLRLNCGYEWNDRLENALRKLGRLACRQLE